jgi:hypothetical protein
LAAVDGALISTFPWITNFACRGSSVTVRSLFRSAFFIALVRASLPSPGAPLTALIRKAGRPQLTGGGSARTGLGPSAGIGIRTGLPFFTFLPCFTFLTDRGGVLRFAAGGVFSGISIRILGLPVFCAGFLAPGSGSPFRAKGLGSGLARDLGRASAGGGVFSGAGVASIGIRTGAAVMPGGARVSGSAACSLIGLTKSWTMATTLGPASEANRLISSAEPVFQSPASTTTCWRYSVTAVP